MRIRSSLLLVAAAVFALATVGFNSAALAQKVSGAIFTTDHCGNFVNGNIYDTASIPVSRPSPDPFACELGKGNYLIAPYLNGGPPPNRSCTAAGLPDGEYYFQVTDPSGKELLSTDSITERRVKVEGGHVSQNLGTHTPGTGKCPTASFGNISVELFPYYRTSNPGGEYKVWMTKVSDWACKISDPTGSGADCGLGGVHGFIPSKSKTDNFKVGDYDGDGIPDSEDNCPEIFDQTNVCGTLPPPSVAFDSGVTSALEPVDYAVTIQIPVTLTGQLTSSVTINFAVTGGTATLGEDFQVVSDGVPSNVLQGTLTFDSSATTQYIEISLIPDNVSDNGETIILELTSVSDGATLGTVTQNIIEVGEVPAF